MKKLLLFCFVLLFATFSYSQLVQLIIPNQVNCDGSNIFNLTNNNAVILAQNPIITANGAFFSYYLTNSDLVTQTNAIANLTSFVSTTSPQTIFVRTNNLTGSDGVGSFSLIVDTPIVVNVVSIISPTCGFLNDGSITANVSGGTAPYLYSLSANNGTFISGPFSSGTFTSLTPGVYTILVIDALGCSSNSNVITIVNPSPVFCSATVTGNAVTINASGGSPPYSYSIVNGGSVFQSSNTFINLAIGLVYTFEVRDANGCTCFSQVDIPLLSIYTNNDAITIYPSNIAIATSSVSVLANDYLNSNLVNNNVSLTPISVPSGFNLNANGTISALAGTAAGTYTIQYQICENTNSSNCATGIATITIPNNGIALKAFIDTNGNGLQDNGEVNFNQGQFGYQLNNGVVNNITSPNGEFLINESNVTNVYNLSYLINPSVASQYTVATSSYTNVSASGTGVTVYNFAVTALPFTDLATYLFQVVTPPRPGFTYLNRLQYSNNGNQAIAAGTVSFTKDAAVTITNISQAGTIANANGFDFQFANLLPGESRFIDVTMLVPTIPTVSLNQVLNNSASVSMPSGDINSANNNSVLSQVILGSYDPNDKVEAHGGKILYSSFTANDYLNYTIQFENTGTFYAENVRINDVLEAKLDENSIRMVNATHPYILNRVGNNLNWNFNGIDLLPNGKGAITFQIKPKPGYALGDIIPNTASIFFDFNPAIVTNTFTTEFVSALGVSEFENQGFSVFPNPTSSNISVALKNNLIIDSVSVYDVLGKTVITKKVANSSTEIDLNKVSKGIYFLKITSGSKVKMMKIIKE